MPAPPTGIAIPLEPLVTRVLAPNPSPFTHTGTQSHIIGVRALAVIDPGPDDPAHLAALLRAIDGRPVSAILVTHHHRDHSPATRALATATGAPIVGAAPSHVSGDGPRADAAFDPDYAPERVLADGETVEGEGWTLRAIATPGHSANHLAFALERSGEDGTALFSGDHVMGWSTSVVSPPDGSMTAYMASLEKLLARDDRVYYPGHGDQVDNPRRWVRGLLGHRKQREGQIMRLLGTEALTVTAITKRMYVGLDPRLLLAAERSVLAHLLDLQARELVWGEATREGARWESTDAAPATAE
ncbi:MBL fold metallo-hydrolase [uncultured Sphingomonas sp.]|uniref:MBL fold metallo-hydrolase n=1 Tax=uncultured Sphingomonas sp. TaxID=158754 RepID=UPI0035CB1A0D